MNMDIDISQVVLHAGELILRPWRPEDLEDLYAYASVEGVGQMAGWLPHRNRQESQRILDLFITGRKTLAIEMNGSVIGSLGLERYNEAQCPELAGQKGREIGYVLAKAYWGRGLMPMAVREACRYLFNDLGADFILCGYFIWNHQSQRVQEKCGFRPYKKIDYQTIDGRTEKTQLNILTADQWKKSGNHEEKE